MFDSIASGSAAFSKWLDKDANGLVFLIGLILLLIIFHQGRKLVRKLSSTLFGATGPVTRHPRWTIAGFTLAGTALGTFVAWRHLLGIDPFGVLTEPMVMGATVAIGLILGLIVGAVVVRLNGRYHGLAASDRRRNRASGSGESVADVYVDRGETEFYGMRNVRKDTFEYFDQLDTRPTEQEYDREVMRRALEAGFPARAAFKRRHTDKYIDQEVVSEFLKQGIPSDDTRVILAQMSRKAERDAHYGIDDEIVARNL